MNTEYLQRLQELDGQGWEGPKEFDYQGEMERVELVKPEIERIVGHELWHNKSVQDASFFTELAWLDDKYYTPGKGGLLVANIAIRFSAFGRMATVYSANRDEKDLLRFAPALVDVLERHGFHFAPEAELSGPYPGKEEWTSGWTWFTRFFDYL
jgi:hypothetical protein